MIKRSLVYVYVVIGIGIYKSICNYEQIKNIEDHALGCMSLWGNERGWGRKM
jgi:hypothetical protein